MDASICDRWIYQAAILLIAETGSADTAVLTWPFVINRLFFRGRGAIKNRFPVRNRQKQMIFNNGLIKADIDSSVFRTRNSVSAIVNNRKCLLSERNRNGFFFSGEKIYPLKTAESRVYRGKSGRRVFQINLQHITRAAVPAVADCSGNGQGTFINRVFLTKR